jgi:hypothetical protein
LGIICPDSSQNAILLVSASQVARITSRSQQNLLKNGLNEKWSETKG